MKQAKEKPLNLEALADELREKGREIWLAGLGALDKVEEEGSRYFQELVERGRAFEQERKQRLTEVIEELESRQKALGEDVQKRLDRLGRVLADVESGVAETMEKALHRLDVPTREEVQDLSKQVQQLAEKVERLAALMEARRQA